MAMAMTRTQEDGGRGEEQTLEEEEDQRFGSLTCFFFCFYVHRSDLLQPAIKGKEAAKTPKFGHEKQTMTSRCEAKKTRVLGHLLLHLEMHKRMVKQTTD
jgi:hypothetical protein